MKMNKVWIVALLLWTLLSCTEKSPRKAWEHMDYPVSITLAGVKKDLRTESVGSSLTASFPNERAIENLLVVVFTNTEGSNTPGTLEKVIPEEQLSLPANGDPYNGKIWFDLGQEGTYHLEFLANAYPKDDTQAKKRILKALAQGISYEQFKRIVIDRPLPQHGASGFVMLTAEPLKISTFERQATDAGVIVLQRLACRFDVFNKLVSDLKLTKITLTKQVKKSYLMRQTKRPPDYATMGNEVVYTPNGDWFTNTMATAGIYSYESNSDISYLILEGTYKGQPWRKEIGLRKKDGGVINIERNHIYRIYLTKGNGTTPSGGDGGSGGHDPRNADKVHCVVEILDWNQDITFDYNDADVWNAEMINPLKYVAEYNIDESGKNFVTDKYATNVSGYLDQAVAFYRFANTTIGGKPYHLPTREEWLSIIPTEQVSIYQYNQEITLTEPISKSSSEEVEVAGK
ncbi:hypothetical protein HMPREF1869_01362, partial [Bacteroidales bacterium KA00251]